MEKFAKPLAIFALLLTIGPPAWMFVAGLSASPTTAPNVSPSTAPAATAATGSNSDSNASAGLMTDSRMKLLMAIGAILWFIASPYWLTEDKPEELIEQAGLQAVP
jgi:hypothetical protein